jgi:ACS family hexuronate transporter-like MFS transporter
MNGRDETIALAADVETRPSPGRIGRFRWVLAGLLVLVTAINYLDRQTLPVVIGEIQRDIPISNVAFARLQALFLLAYAIMYAGGGRFVDLVGTRYGYAVVAGFWSAACAAHALASSVLALGTARFFLGLGEGGGFPASAKAVAEWFPPRERSMAVGLFNTGSAAGAVVAPPLVAGIALALGWRAVFLVTGAIGLLWAIAWFAVYALPANSRLVGAAERQYVLAACPPHGTGAAVPWRDLLRIRPVWTLIVAKFLTDGAWFFFIFWLPKYLGDARGFDMAAIGSYAWIPYAFAGVGSLASGWVSSLLIRRHLTLDASRKIALGVGAALMPLSLLVVRSPIDQALLFVSLAFLGHQFWSVIVQTLPADLFPAEAVGSVAGLIGCAGSLGAMVFNLLVGAILDASGSYAVPFVMAGVLHPASFILILVTLGRIEPLPLPARRHAPAA